jgi:beta-RFAP synthase
MDQVRIMSAKGFTSVKIHATARLHLGFIDLNGGLGRIYGSLGVALEQPETVLEVQRIDEGLKVSGQRQNRVKLVAQQVMEHFNFQQGFQVTVSDSIPKHVGLGSGTQLSLALSLGITMLNGLEVSIPELAQSLYRGIVSGIGTATFEHGGFVIDGGRSTTSLKEGLVDVPPLLFQSDVPDDWLFVVAIPKVAKGLSGSEERIAFDTLPAGPKTQAEVASRLVLMKLLPALLQNDIQRFGEALTRIQILVGDVFSVAQGGRFSSSEVANCVTAMIDAGAVGAGQSSWGPACYGLVQGKKAASEIKKSVSEVMDSGIGGSAFISGVNNYGARVTTD